MSSFSLRRGFSLLTRLYYFAPKNRHATQAHAGWSDDTPALKDSGNKVTSSWYLIWQVLAMVSESGKWMAGGGCGKKVLHLL